MLLFFGQLAELSDVLLGDAQLHGLVAAVQLDRLGDAADAFGGGRRDRQDRRRLTFRLVDLLLAGRFRRLDDLLLVAFGGVDGGVALCLPT